MSTVTNNATSAGSTTSAVSKDKDALADVDVNQFLKLMIAELQNQDPLNPLDNAQMIAQIGELRSISSTDKLTSTPDSVLLGQNIASAAGLIGADIDAISDDNQRVSGTVGQVSVADGQPKLHLSQSTDAVPSTAKGNMEKGSYEYRVVWRDSKGKLIGVNPAPEGSDPQKGSITIDGKENGGQAVTLRNLPKSEGPKQIYRRVKGGDSFQLVDVINDPKQATYVDTKSNADLSTALTGIPSLLPVQDSRRSFVVSLNNIGEIRSLGDTTSGTGGTSTASDPTDDSAANDDESSNDTPST